MKSWSPRLGGSCSALATVLLLGCGASEPEAPAAAPLPAYVRIAVVDALVGPGMNNGQAWDGPGSVSTGALEALSSALSRIDPRAAAAAAGAAVLNAGASALEPPDPKGWVDLFVNGQPQGRLTLDREGQRDTFTPTWAGPPAWSRVPLHPGVRITGELQDDDIKFADPMGHFQIAYDEIVAALRAGRVHPVKVADQTYNQVLFVGIEVMPVP